MRITEGLNGVPKVCHGLNVNCIQVCLVVAASNGGAANLDTQDRYQSRITSKLESDVSFYYVFSYLSYLWPHRSVACSMLIEKTTLIINANYFPVCKNHTNV